MKYTMIVMIPPNPSTGRPMAVAHRLRVIHGSGLSVHPVLSGLVRTTSPRSISIAAGGEDINHPPTIQRKGRTNPRKKRIIEDCERGGRFDVDGFSLVVRFV